MAWAALPPADGLGTMKTALDAKIGVMIKLTIAVMATMAPVRTVMNFFSSPSVVAIDHRSMDDSSSSITLDISSLA